MNKLDVTIFHMEEPTGNLLAYASVAINDTLAVSGLKVMDSEKGVFVAMPSHKVDGAYEDIFNPTTKEARQELIDAVLKAFSGELPDQAQEAVKCEIRARAYPVENPTNKHIGDADIVLNKSFCMKGFKVMEGEDGLRATMPSRKDMFGEYHDICRPVSKEAYAALNSVIVGAYEKAAEKAAARAEHAQDKPSVTEKLKDAAAKASKAPKPEKSAPQKAEQAL